MGLLDWILNLACVLLWINWRSVKLTAPGRSSPLSLASTLKKTESKSGARWLSLAGLAAVLAVRTFFYWNVGSAMNWTPTLELEIISLPFRSDYFGRILMFSGLSFGLVLGGLYDWLLLLSVINRKLPSDDPVQRLVRLHLGFLERWPVTFKLLLPMLVTTLLWGLGSPALVRLGIVPPANSARHLWEQAILLGLTSYLLWKFLVLALCLLYLVNSYVYLGNSAFWQFVNSTGTNLLSPLRRLPLCIGKVDLAPFLAMGLVLGVTRLADLWLPRLFQGLSP